MTLNEMVRRQQEAERTAQSEQAESHRRLTKEEIAAQRIAAREQLLLINGLQQLRDGKPPTKAQLPVVQRYITELGKEKQQQAKAVEDALSSQAYTEYLYNFIITSWNAVTGVLRAIGVEYYEGGAVDGHGWRGEVNGLKGGQEGYATEADALKAALQWRISIAEEANVKALPQRSTLLAGIPSYDPTQQRVGFILCTPEQVQGYIAQTFREHPDIDEMSMYDIGISATPRASYTREGIVGITGATQKDEEETQ